jgi:predicted alpha-1,6-mannanase (GH76 family)
LHQLTPGRTAAYLESAIAAYDWSTRNLVGSDGLYANSMRADGSLDQTRWIYNQGIFIGAGVLLYQATGEAAYLSDAIRVADATLRTFATDAYYSGATGAYSGRGIFNAIFFRNLLLLLAVTRDGEYLRRMQAYADAVWSDSAVHDLRTDRFRLNGETRFSLLDQAAMVQVFAVLSWEPARYSSLT